MPYHLAGENPLPAEIITDSIDQQLGAAKAELHALEQAVDALPEIFEAKFRQGVAAVLETNRQLLAQQVLLRSQCSGLPPVRRPSAWVWPSIRLPRLQLPAVQARQLAVVLLASAGVGLLAWAGAQWSQHQSARLTRRSALVSVPESPVTVNQGSTLVLRATGTSWVEVQDLSTREVLLIDLLEPGQQRQIRLRQGLRIRSGRPDLLSIQIDAGAQQPFGGNVGLGWRTVLPPTLRRAGA